MARDGLNLSLAKSFFNATQPVFGPNLPALINNDVDVKATAIVGAVCGFVALTLAIIYAILLKTRNPDAFKSVDFFFTNHSHTLSLAFWRLWYNNPDAHAEEESAVMIERPFLVLVYLVITLSVT